MLPDFPLGLTPNLTNLNITNKMATDVSVTLDPSKASGPDEVPEVLLKKCSPELTPILCRWFKKCVAKSNFPSCWKLAFVVSVFKIPGERNDPRNYCPISILSIISKVFESLINSCITLHLESLNLFSDHQYGLRSGRSTADALTVICERINQSLDACG